MMKVKLSSSIKILKIDGMSNFLNYSMTNVKVHLASELGDLTITEDGLNKSFIA